MNRHACMQVKATAGQHRLRRLPSRIGLFGCAIAALAAATGAHAQPQWAGAANTTEQNFRFTTPHLQAGAEALRNPYGNPQAAVVVTAPFGTGWQDPTAAFSTSGVNEDGAWDLGPEGTITVTLPFAPTLTDPGLSYRLEFHVRLVAYEIPVALPVVTAPGLGLEGVSSSVVTVKQETLGRYRAVTWTAAAAVAQGNAVSLLFTATSQGALIDEIEVHTRYTVVGVPQHAFSSWIAQAYPDQSDPAVIGFTATPLGDGVANGLKYYLGIDPGAQATPFTIVSADATTLVFTHSRNRQETPDVVGVYEWSLDLKEWLESGASLGAVSTSFATTLIDDSHPDTLLVEVTATTMGNDRAHIFARLRIMPLEPAD